MEKLGNITIYNADCLDIMREMPDNAFQLAICDPPYGINRSGQLETFTKNPKHKRKFIDDKKWDNNIPTKEYFDELFRVSENQIIWGGNYFVEYLKPSMGWIFWDKGQDLTMSDGELAYTSFNRALRRKVINRAELVKQNTFHPTEKPYKLYKWLLANYAKKGDKILDTHFGSLSIGIACFESGHELTAIELDSSYYESGKNRLKNYMLQQKLF